MFKYFEKRVNAANCLYNEGIYPRCRIVPSICFSCKQISLLSITGLHMVWETIWSRLFLSISIWTPVYNVVPIVYVVTIILFLCSSGYCCTATEVCCCHIWVSYPKLWGKHGALINTWFDVHTGYTNLKRQICSSLNSDLDFYAKFDLCFMVNLWLLVSLLLTGYARCYSVSYRSRFVWTDI